MSVANNKENWGKDVKERCKLYEIDDRMPFRSGREGATQRAKVPPARQGRGQAAPSRFADPNGYGAGPGEVSHPEIHEEPVYNDEEMPF